MRKLLVSATCAGVLAAPASLAFAADQNDNKPRGGEPAAKKDGDRRARDERLRITGDAATPAVFQLTVDDTIEQASARLDKATNRIETRHDTLRTQALKRKRERRKERRAEEAEAEAAEASAAAAPAEGPAPTSGGSTASPALEGIAQCESGGDPSAVSPDGQYRGKYQFTPETWQGVGGSGDPAAAPEAEQDMRAQMLLEQSGSGQWPVCGG
ncbi:MAG TPA: transglycosylase family protein [Thermoleophilaceae bacterium]|nr:transglycosylase family protein [Thermoleophilaceae bacterium]